MVLLPSLKHGRRLRSQSSRTLRGITDTLFSVQYEQCVSTRNGRVEATFLFSSCFRIAKPKVREDCLTASLSLRRRESRDSLHPPDLLSACCPRVHQHCRRGRLLCRPSSPPIRPRCPLNRRRPVHRLPLGMNLLPSTTAPPRLDRSKSRANERHRLD